MKTLAIVTVTAAMAFGSGLAAAGDAAVSCPASIETSQALRSELPSGWEAAQQDGQGKRVLLGASLSDGPPVERFILMPVNMGRRKDGWMGYRWSLGSSDGIYLTCIYDHTTVRLMRRLEAGFKACEVLRDPKFGEFSAACSR
jgi:hypothetical protein